MFLLPLAFLFEWQCLESGARLHVLVASTPVEFASSGLWSTWVVCRRFPVAMGAVRSLATHSGIQRGMLLPAYLAWQPSLWRSVERRHGDGPNSSIVA